MWVYQIRQRGTRWQGEAPPEFPSRGSVSIELSPRYQFGGVVEPARTVAVGSGGRATWNAHNGRQSFESESALEPVDVTIKHGDDGPILTVKANVATYTKDFESRAELETAIEYLTYIFPLTLNTEALDTPVVERTFGSVGGIDFGWELLRSSPGTFDATTTDIQEARILRAWQEALLFNTDSNQRLLAALKYFHIACRLERSGHSPWEFLAEIVLNLAKTLEALFPAAGKLGSIDTARRGLTDIGYTKDEIDRDFIPALALRNKLDVGHVSLAVFQVEDMEVVHRYCDAAEGKFRGMLKRVLSMVTDGSYQVKPYKLRSPTRDVLQTIERIRNSLATEDTGKPRHSDM